MNDDRDSDRGVRLRFHRNEAALNPPDSVVRALRSLDAEALRRYPVEAQARLISSLADRLNVCDASVVLANGADELLLGLGRAFLAPGDEAIFVAPSFGMYEQSVRSSNGIARVLRYRKRWQLDVDALLALATPRTRLVLLGSPNNPTTDALRPGELARIALALPYATIAVDEVYVALLQRSLLPTARAYQNVVTIGSLSKTAGLAGLRVGYAIADRGRASALRRSIAPYPLGIASIVAAQAYLDDPLLHEYQTRLAAQVARSLDRIVAALEPRAQAVWRGDVSFALFDFGSEGRSIAAALSEQGIAVRTFDDPSLAGMVRICAAGDDETEALLEAWQRIGRERCLA